MKNVLSCIKKAFGIFKKIINKIFGKARWYVIALVICLLFGVVPSFFSSCYPYVIGVRNDKGEIIKELPLNKVVNFAINDKGEAVINCNYSEQGVVSVQNIDSGEVAFSGTGIITTDLSENSSTYADNYAITDDNEIYAVNSEILIYRSQIYTKDTIIRLSNDYKYEDEVCSFEYDESERLRDSILSRLHYYNGEVTFASVEKSGVWLYAIDVKSKIVSKSDFYPTDENGTFTTAVIPLDGAYLFLRSDGNVYKVGFNEPLGDSIYRFNIDSDEICDNPYFTQAVLVNDTLYVMDDHDASVVYSLEDGKLTPVIDLSEVSGKDYSKIKYMDAYKPEGASEEKLVLCLEDDILIYSGGNIDDRDIILEFRPTILMYLNQFLLYLMEFVILGLIINLIIRRKTLLYKQLIVTLPVMLGLAIFVAVENFISEQELFYNRVSSNINIICELGTTEFDGYDFSDLMKVDEETGAAYQDLSKKVEKMSANKDKNWSEDYVFSIVYKNDMNDAVILLGDDRVYMPMYDRDMGKFAAAKENSVGVYEDNVVLSLLDDDEDASNIAAYGRINDKQGAGRYYFVVSTDKASFRNTRMALLVVMVVYSVVVIGVMVLLLVISILFISRTIKKATKTVKTIADGDFSARVSYKSKDELGEICSEVNEMGKNLEALFKEKDETEEFYYKFVPEKFRELLGKEKFTDLTLGDAKSSDLTVLFCDIRSFSINSEMMTAKENFAFVNVIYGKMGPIVRKNNGFVDKYIGDAVMALFENADDAVRCGVEMYHEIVLNPETAKELNVSDINIGIGVHTGMAMVGIVGEEERLAGTVISDTVNLSSRLESLTKQYKTAMLISKDTVDRMSDADSLGMRYLGMVQVAGVNEVKALYEVLDCLPDEQKKKRSECSEEFREAIRLFLLGRRDEAANALQSIVDSGKDDYVIDMYLKYINELSDEDKSNVFRFVRK